MALYKCLNSSCENYNSPKSVLSDNETATCPDCGATMKRHDFIYCRNQRKGGEK